MEIPYAVQHWQNGWYSSEREPSTDETERKAIHNTYTHTQHDFKLNQRLKSCYLNIKWFSFKFSSSAIVARSLTLTHPRALHV